MHRYLAASRQFSRDPLWLYGVPSANDSIFLLSCHLRYNIDDQCRFLNPVRSRQVPDHPHSAPGSRSFWHSLPEREPGMFISFEDDHCVSGLHLSCPPSTDLVTVMCPRQVIDGTYIGQCRYAEEFCQPIRSASLCLLLFFGKYYVEGAKLLSAFVMSSMSRGYRSEPLSESRTPLCSPLKRHRQRFFA